MKTKIVEVTNGPRNWGKFMLGQFTWDEWNHESRVSPGAKLLTARGWSAEHMLVLDLETGEGVIVQPGGSAKADLEKHAVWVCPMFEPFLEFLYAYSREYAEAKKKDPELLRYSLMDGVPPLVDLPDAEFAMAGYRREGGDEAR